MKGLCLDGAKAESRHISGDFMRDSVAVVKEDTRFTLRYEDGKMVLSSDQQEEGNKEEEEMEGSGSDGNSDDDNGESGDGSGESDNDNGESDGLGSDLNSDDEQQQSEDNHIDSKEKGLLYSNDADKKAASEELPYTFTGTVHILYVNPCLKSENNVFSSKKPG